MTIARLLCAFYAVSTPDGVLSPMYSFAVPGVAGHNHWRAAERQLLAKTQGTNLDRVSTFKPVPCVGSFLTPRGRPTVWRAPRPGPHRRCGGGGGSDDPSTVNGPRGMVALAHRASSTARLAVCEPSKSHGADNASNPRRAIIPRTGGQRPHDRQVDVTLLIRMISSRSWGPLLTFWLASSSSTLCSGDKTSPLLHWSVLSYFALLCTSNSRLKFTRPTSCKCVPVRPSLTCSGPEATAVALLRTGFDLQCWNISNSRPQSVHFRRVFVARCFCLWRWTFTVPGFKRHGYCMRNTIFMSISHLFVVRNTMEEFRVWTRIAATWISLDISSRSLSRSLEGRRCPLRSRSLRSWFWSHGHWAVIVMTGLVFLLLCEIGGSSSSHCIAQWCPLDWLRSVVFEFSAVLEYASGLRTFCHQRFCKFLFSSPTI